MVLMERMQALGDHARSSTQRLIEERRQQTRARETHGSDDEADVLDTYESGNGADAEEAIVADRIDAHLAADNRSPVGDVTDISESGIDSAIESAMADSMPEDTYYDELPQVPLQEPANDAAAPVAESAGAGPAAPAFSRESDSDLAARRAIIHEWENWSALNPDELGDPNVATYFFRHLEARKPRLLDFAAEDQLQTIRSWLVSERRLAA